VTRVYMSGPSDHSQTKNLLYKPRNGRRAERRE